MSSVYGTFADSLCQVIFVRSLSYFCTIPTRSSHQGDLEIPNPTCFTATFHYSIPKRVMNMPFEKDVLKSIIKKPVTIDYPRHPAPVSTILRGKPGWKHELCIGCQRCARDCPATAITVAGKPPHVQWDIDYGSCLFCGQCERSCPTKAITLSHTLEAPTSTRTSMMFHGTQVELPKNPNDES